MKRTRRIEITIFRRRMIRASGLGPYAGYLVQNGKPDPAHPADEDRRFVSEVIAVLNEPGSASQIPSTEISQLSEEARDVEKPVL